MMLRATLTLCLLAGFGAAAPFSLPNGFPNLDQHALQQVSKTAGGTLPNTPLPTSLPDDTITTLRVLAFSEIFEVAYFSSLLSNITHEVEGYNSFSEPEKEFYIEILEAVVAASYRLNCILWHPADVLQQEELHAFGANAFLASAGYPPIPACNYQFLATDQSQAVRLAGVFTEVVLGALQSVASQFASRPETQPLVQLIASIIGQEGEQAGAYRLLQGLVPSSSPFLTTSTGPLAFNAIASSFIVPGSCDNVLATIGIPLIDTLGFIEEPEPKDDVAKFRTSCTQATPGANFIAYISGQNKPVVVPISDVHVDGDKATLCAPFPFEQGFSRGVTLAVLVNTDVGLESAADVTAAAIAGPAAVQID